LVRSEDSTHPTRTGHSKVADTWTSDWHNPPKSPKNVERDKFTQSAVPRHATFLGQAIQWSDQMTDGELVRRVVAGESAAYGELVRRWCVRLLAFCRARVVSDQADSEDLAQEVFVRAFVNLRSLGNPEQFGPWLRGIAVHACADWGRDRFRQQRSFGRRDFEADLTSIADLDGSSPNDDERTIVAQHIESMPEDLREVILLRYYDDLTYDEMAEWLGIARATVNDRLARARALLRIRLASLRSDR
jgi:RNA polymerase sigma-70 factor (ECF subfamily)